MAELLCPDVTVYLCPNCVPTGARLARQWNQDGAHVVVRDVPCTGKIDVQYLFHAFEGGHNGVCVIACPKGECKLAQGNYRAQIRVATVQRLLGEIGLEPERVELLHCSPNDPAEVLEKLVRDAVKRFSKLGENPIRLSHAPEVSTAKG